MLETFTFGGGDAHLNLEVGMEYAHRARLLQKLDREGLRFTHLCHDRILNVAIVHHVFVVVRVPAAEEIGQ